MKRYDVVCFVKRFDHEMAACARSLGKAVVYDIVDPWRQPDDEKKHNTLPRIFHFFHEMFGRVKADGLIFPNRMMFDDYAHLTRCSTVIYHHYRPNIKTTVVRETPKLVGYEGRVDFLGRWQEDISDACRKLGMRFVTNPSSLAELDIGFAARSGKFGNLLSARYKSNVKLANMIGAGIPALVNADEASYQETNDGSVQFFQSRQDLLPALESLLPFEKRLQIHRSFLASRARYSLPNIVDQFESFFRRVISTSNSIQSCSTTKMLNTHSRNAA